MLAGKTMALVFTVLIVCPAARAEEGQEAGHKQTVPGAGALQGPPDAGTHEKTYVIFTSHPPGARIFVEYKLIGSTPMAAALERGRRYWVGVKLEGYERYTTYIYTTGERQRFSCRLVPLKTARVSTPPKTPAENAIPGKEVENEGKKTKEKRGFFGAVNFLLGFSGGVVFLPEFSELHGYAPFLGMKLGPGITLGGYAKIEFSFSLDIYYSDLLSTEIYVSPWADNGMFFKAGLGYYPLGELFAFPIGLGYCWQAHVCLDLGYTVAIDTLEGETYSIHTLAVTVLVVPDIFQIW